VGCPLGTLATQIQRNSEAAGQRLQAAREATMWEDGGARDAFRRTAHRAGSTPGSASPTPPKGSPPHCFGPGLPGAVPVTHLRNKGAYLKTCRFRRLSTRRQPLQFGKFVQTSRLVERVCPGNPQPARLSSTPPACQTTADGPERVRTRGRTGTVRPAAGPPGPDHRIHRDHPPRTTGASPAGPRLGGKPRSATSTQAAFGESRVAMAAAPPHVSAQAWGRDRNAVIAGPGLTFLGYDRWFGKRQADSSKRSRQGPAAPSGEGRRCSGHGRFPRRQAEKAVCEFSLQCVQEGDRRRVFRCGSYPAL
jgi:hypothetical protein